MEGLQRSNVSFRRQGSSGLVWDDKFLAGLNQLAIQQQQQKELDDGGDKPREESKEDPTAAEVRVASPAVGSTIDRSRSNGGRGFRTGRVSPAIEPPSPKVSACGFCGAFGKGKNTRRRVGKSGKRVM